MITTLNRKYVVCAAGRRDYHQVPLALAEADALDRLVTTSYSPDILYKLADWLPEKLSRVIRSRHIEEISSRKVSNADLSAEIQKKILILRNKDVGELDSRTSRLLGQAAAKRALLGHTGAVVYSYHWSHFINDVSESQGPYILFQPHPAPWHVREVLSQFRRADDEAKWFEPEELQPPAKVERYAEDVMHAAAVFVPSSFVANGFTKIGFPRDRIFVLPYGGDFSAREARSLWQPSELAGKTAKPVGGPLSLLWVGQVVYRKGILDVFNALRLLKPGTAELTVICQTPPDPTLLRAMPPSATIRRGVSDADLTRAYLDHDLFVMPSLLEGFGLVYLEALTYGLPIIATRNTGAPDVIRDGAEGFLVDPGDSRAIAGRIQHLAEDRDALLEMSDQAASLGKKLTWTQFRELVRTSVKNVEDRFV